MPDVNRYKDKAHFMQDCMHITKNEGLTQEQSLGKCINMWRQKGKKTKRKMAQSVISSWLSISKEASVPVDLAKAEKSDKPSVFLGGFCEKNEWRKEIKKEIQGLSFIDPYDPNWEPMDNIYDELTGLMKADYVIFYKGGKGSKKEKDFLDQNEKEYKEFEDLDKLKDYLKSLIGTAKTAKFPDHPNDIVISKKDSLVGVEMSELDVYSYYTNGVVTEMLKELKGNNLFIGMKLKDHPGPKPLYIRHPYDKKTEYIRISNEKDFQEYHSGRTVEFHRTMPALAPFYVVDFDAVEDWATTKKITGEVADMLDKLPEIKSVDIYYTGKRGFHIRGNLKKPMPVDKAREALKEHLKEAFGDRDDLVLGESPAGKKGALGVSPMKLNGGQVALWSLRVTGLCCVEVPRAKLAGFKREDARPEKVYKKLTGRTLVPAREKSAYETRQVGDKDIPITEIKELPGKSLEKPTVNAVKSLLNERPSSSGWNSGFKPPCWAIIFDGRISDKARKTAEKVGLKVRYRDIPRGNIPEQYWIPTVTDIYLPDISKNNPDKAQEIFDNFAKEYKNTSKKESAIRLIKAFLNKISGYDREKIKPGYTGKFVIHHHWAQNEHFDLRLEFPVVSVKEALHEYSGKRQKDTPEPGADSKEKAGTVLRSWAIPKHKLPTTKPILATETEDHEISYFSFHGKIPEGSYGAGTVDIFDKGTFELVDAIYDKKYVFNLKGKKAHGTYALIKTGPKTFLWVKTKIPRLSCISEPIRKMASAIDYVRPTMHPGIWDIQKSPPDLKPEVRKEIFDILTDNYKKFFKSEVKKDWIKGIYISGSAASYNYKEDGDLDVDIVYSPDMLQRIHPQSEQDRMQSALDKNRNKKAGDTNLTYSFFLLVEGDFPKSDGIYSLLEKKWIHGPIKIPEAFDPDRVFLRQKDFAVSVLDMIYTQIAEIKIALKDLKRIDQYIKGYDRLQPRRLIVLSKLKDLCLYLASVRMDIWKLHEDSLKEKPIFPAFNYSRDWDERYILFKCIARYGGHEPIRLLYSMIDDEDIKIVKKFIPEEALGRFFK